MSSKGHMHWAMLLHNEMQRQGRLKALTWDDQVAGPTHNAVWTCSALINEIEYGRGMAPNRQAARDEAARQALQAIQEELMGNAIAAGGLGAAGRLLSDVDRRRLWA
ncbi:hypothetical protein Clacol_005906 [Clathrus columnatus]|uniref:DRBM domain-containing protein n=1 Tax=Clathrus columnatus TaxID=1419009 RepID=A0AAV5ABF0_9AGAM|nr:hypothetical protein Clacol_005906 [Clathrus columnatus]